MAQHAIAKLTSELSKSNGNLEKLSPSGKPETPMQNRPSKRLILAHQASFLLTGIVTTISNQIIFYQGGAQPQTGLLSFPSYVGMFLVILLPVTNPGGMVQQKIVMASASMDVFANVMCMAGLQLVGSGIFQVLYASVICFTALLSKLALGKSLSTLQWIAIFGIAAGLGITSLHSGHSHPHLSAAAEAAETWTLILGIGTTLTGCLGYASSYVINESILSRNPSVNTQRLCWLVGLYGVLLHLAYFSVYTFPNWEELMVDHIKEKHGSFVTVMELYTVNVVSGFLHNINFFFLLRHSGSVSTGVIQALRAIGVFVASGLLFCNSNQAQCMTTEKGIAAVMVSGCVVLYSMAKIEGKSSLADLGGKSLADLSSMVVETKRFGKPSMDRSDSGASKKDDGLIEEIEMGNQRA